MPDEFVTSALIVASGTQPEVPLRYRKMYAAPALFATSSSKRAPLPQFILRRQFPDVAFHGADPASDDIVNGFQLTGYFLDKHVWGPRDIKPPLARARLITMI